MNLKDLQKVIPEQWKMQSGRAGDKKGSVVAYIDARDVMKLLDEVVGPENWKDEYHVLLNNDVRCRLSIKCGDDWIGKEDVGTPSNQDAEKGAFSDAFKRAAVKWGVGRFLYDMEIKWVDLDSNGKPIDKFGKRIYDMTAYIKGLSTTQTQPQPTNSEVRAEEPKASAGVEIYCNKCGSSMREKTGPKGPFLGCSNYPNCRNTMPITVKLSAVNDKKVTESDLIMDAIVKDGPPPS